MVRPIASAVPVSFPYGVKYKSGVIHKGVDFSRGREGEPVFAMYGGVVTHAGYGGWGSAYGQHVIIRSTFKGKTKWHIQAHLKTESVRVGQSVKAGQQIGTSGGKYGMRYSGNSTGPHLHSQVCYQNRYDRYENPWPMIEATAPTPPKPITAWEDGLFWNLAASDGVYGKKSWDKRVPKIIKALKHYDRNINLLAEAECNGEQGRVFAAALSTAGFKVAVADNQRMIVVKKAVKVGATKIVELDDRGPANDNKQIVMAVLTPPGSSALVAESGHFEFRDGAKYDKTRANQAKQTKAETIAFAKAHGIGENRIVFGNDENAKTGTNAAWGTNYTDLRSRSNVVYGNANYSTLCGWDGKADKSSSPYCPDKVRVHKSRPVVGGSTSLTFLEDDISDHLPVVFTLGKQS